MKRYIVGLGEMMKNRERFDLIPPKIQKSIYDYLLLHRKKRRLEKAKKELIQKFNSEKKHIEKEIKRVTRDETTHYRLIKNITNNYNLANIYCERDRNSFRLNIHFCGLNKKCSLGTDLKRIKIVGNSLAPSLKEKITLKNFKSLIPIIFRDELNDFLVDNGIDKFNDSKKLKFNYNTLKFEYTFQELDVIKSDRVRKSNRIKLDAKNKKSRSIGKIHQFGQYQDKY